MKNWRSNTFSFLRVFIRHKKSGFAPNGAKGGPKMAAKTYLKTVLTISLFIVVLAASTTAHAKTIYVDDDAPADFSNIQAAIDNAYDGDTIIVADGIYTGDGNRDIDFLGKAITVRSENGANNCIIDCEYKGWGFYFHSNEGADSVLDGLTITNSHAWFGSGIYCNSAIPTLTNCTISRNWVGGMWNYRSSPTLTNCTFSANGTGDAHGGGGIYNEESSPTLVDCTFSGNSADDDGGGMYNLNNSNPILINCRFSGNEVKYGSGGGMTNLCDSSPILVNCTFTGNWGGGMRNWDNSNPTLINCTFSGNFFGGGGISSANNSNPTLTNCILWGDTPSEITVGGGTPVIRYSCVQGGWLGDGNIDTGPRFITLGFLDDNGTPDWIWDDVWVEGDYHLLADSPCIDAGSNVTLPADVADLDGDGDTEEPIPIDLDGNPRVINGRVDMGAYEYSPPIPADIRIIPRTINLRGEGQWIAAFIRLPEEYDVADIEPNSISLENEIEPERFWPIEYLQIAIAKFNREDVQPILEVGDIELTITGRLTDGTPFEAADTIKVIERGGKK
jgi:parallel beta-helix repeat protein